MGLVIISFLVVFLLISSGALLVFYRDALPQRIADAINPRPKKRNVVDAIKESGLSIGGVVEHFEQVLPKSQAEVSVAAQRLSRAGFRDASAINVFYGSKVLVPLVLAGIALLSGLAKTSPFFVYSCCLGLGYLGPDFWLGRRIKTRQKKMEKGLPDVLDLLIICIEAGLSLDQATARTSEELQKPQPELCDEFGILVLEQRAGRPRSEAWKNLAERTGVESIRNLVSVLVQSEQFGTSVAKTLRVHSETMRTKRTQQIEEMAAKTSVKLVFPLVFFIFPSLFLVTLGPAVITMAESFKTLFGN
jgi:tight adherence protein C